MNLLKQALTFDDVLLVPAHSTIMPKEVDLTTQLTKNIKLNTPILSAAMDTVTEANLAIAIAQEGGIGMIHKNMSVEQQAKEVRAVKKFESGVVRDPITIDADGTIRELLDIKLQHNISGVPVMEQGMLVGIVTSRDVRYETNMNAHVRTLSSDKELSE